MIPKVTNPLRSTGAGATTGSAWKAAGDMQTQVCGSSSGASSSHSARVGLRRGSTIIQSRVENPSECG